MTPGTYLDRARAARDESLRRVASHAPADWIGDAKLCVAALARTRKSFTTDDVWGVIGQPPEPRALGAVMMSLSRQGVIAKTGGYVNSARPRCHARPIPMWGPTNVLPALSRTAARQVLAGLRSRYESEAA